ncbi:hypothetical protein ACFL2R_03150 [Patescibacteria group bacterium]
MTQEIKKQHFVSDLSLREMYFLEYANACKAITDFMGSDVSNKQFVDLWKKLGASVELLRLLYKSQVDSPLSIDLHSGSLYEVELRGLVSQLELKDERLTRLVDPGKLRQMLVNSILEEKKFPQNYMSELYLHSFLDKINAQQIFSRFTDFTITEIEKSESTPESTHRCVWGVYDIRSNCPGVYVMEFHSDIKLSPRIISEIERAVIKKTSGVVSPGLLGTRVDQELEYLHPKTVRCLYLHQFSGKSIADMQNGKLSRGLAEYGREGEFIVLMRHELAISFRYSETESKGWLFTKKKRRQIWHQSADPENQSKLIAKSSNYIIMPHRVAQNVNDFSEKDDIIAY